MRLEQLDRVAILRLEAGRANVMNAATLGKLDDLLEELSQDLPGALVVTGQGPHFSGGLDLSGLMGEDRHAMADFLKTFGAVMTRLFLFPRPVVAAINGHAIAGGCVLAMQADRRLMAEGDARIGLNEVQIGVGLPTVVTETVRCQVPPQSLFPICLEGHLFTPPGAQAVGLVDALAPPERLIPQALALAQKLADIPSLAYQQVKQSLRRPVVDQIERFQEDDLYTWLDTWFSPDARTRIEKVLQRLAAKT
ncbi:MAG TPA: enoyl-CoA hydratase/isomerase family protein [Candidatus Xenobia bacterium]|jgi:enoyl-CoA hydratase